MKEKLMQYIDVLKQRIAANSAQIDQGKPGEDQAKAGNLRSHSQALNQVANELQAMLDTADEQPPTEAAPATSQTPPEEQVQQS